MPAFLNSGQAQPEADSPLVREHAKISEQRVTVADLAIQCGLAGFCATGAASVAAAVAPVSIAVMLLASLGGLRLWIARKTSLPRWVAFVSIFADFVLYFLVLIAFHWRPNAHPSLTLEAPTFAFLFVLIALRALRFDLREMIFAGAAAAFGWAALTVFALATAGPSLISLDIGRIIVVQMERIVAIACFCGVICLACQRGALYLRQAAAETGRAIEALDRETALNHKLEQESAAKEKANRLLYQAANFDRLTGLENRHAFLRRAERAAGDYASDRSRSFAIGVVDLNRFRSFNDGLGRAAGDALIRQAAERLKAVLLPGERLGRVGADEFAVLLPSPPIPALAVAAAERFRSALDAPIEADGHSFISGATVGLALVEPGDSGIAVFTFADIALNHAKQRGGRGYQVHNAASRPDIASRSTLEHSLRDALVRNELLLHYQPLVRLSDGRVSGWEALARWIRNDGVMVSPSSFIPIAEETGTIVDIGAWALRQASSDARRFVEAGADRAAFMSVNVSPRQFADPRRLTRSVADAVRSFPRLKLEVTESAVVEDPARALELLESLGRTGAQLSLDDFGTGASSLSQLRRFPFTTLKIDQSFVRDETPSGRRYLRSIVGIAAALDIETVAEGIETEADLAACIDFGVTHGQGYLMGKPAGFDAVLEACRSFPAPAAKTVA